MTQDEPIMDGSTEAGRDEKVRGIVDQLTARHGLVTSEMIPTAMSLDDSQRTTQTPLAEYDY